ncbi:ribulokinase [Echinicola rosea]|uniref:Ribulokinase n=1 Tax=Echinicola rosea TaxID=1807691 RepID=A0ABQ1UUC0_9BACT|nr:ribulokinase [Echinicola rosea]GGF25422.1 ribulokinase [Echinicola rosea]
MSFSKEAIYVIGLDYGTDSVRASLVNAGNGRVLASDVYGFSRWLEGRYCEAIKNQFRQHPLDHLEGLEATILGVLESSGVDRSRVRAIGVDTTGSSPVPVNDRLFPLSLTPEFSDNPNAMVVLWKDHTAVGEAEEINALCHTWGGEDYTKYSGGIYSSEWFWSKILHIIRHDPRVANSAHSWLEHCDWVVAELVGCHKLEDLKRSRCAAGHKAMWHPVWGGLPSKAFLGQLSPLMADLRDRLYSDTFTADQSAGTLSTKWAKRLGLSEATLVTVGTLDAHAGAVGGGIKDMSLVKVMGTSTCDMMVASVERLGDRAIRGICGQVEGAILPNMVGLEAGQSAFGDVLAWLKSLILQQSIELIRGQNELERSIKEDLIKSMEDRLLAKLSKEASELPLTETLPVALDWINGRRTPDANQNLKGALAGLSMGTDAVRLFKALVVSICFGSKKIVDRFAEEGIGIDHVIGMGGVALKSPLVMQTLADVLDIPVSVSEAEQAPALGAAIYAAVAAGIQPDIHTAMNIMAASTKCTYRPIKENVEWYKERYPDYLELAAFAEEQAMRPKTLKSYI